MNRCMRQFLNIFSAIGLLILWSCEPFYDPVVYEDVPSSPASTWDKERVIVKKTTERPFTSEDLTQDIPLSKLLDIALYNNPSTRASWNAARASAYAYRSSLSSYYPTIAYAGSLNAQENIGSTFSLSGNDIISGTSPTGPSHRPSVNMFNEITLTYLLLDFGGREATAELARQTLIASNWQHNYTMQQVMLSVLTAYTSYIGNKGLVDAYSENLKDAEVALNAAKVMHSAGLATLTDILFAQSNVEQTRANLIQAKGSENTAIGQLLIAVGLPADSEINIEDLPKELPVIEISGDISSLLELAKKKRPDLGIAIAAIKEQEADLAISYSNSMPTLSTNLEWAQFKRISPRAPSGYNEVASLQLNIPIFNGFFYLNQQRQLRAQVEEALANLDIQVAVVSSQVVTNYYSFKAAEGALPSSEAAVEFSQRAFRGYVVQYKTGTSSILDVLNSLTALSNARAQAIITRTQWAISLANLAFSVGILDDTSGMWKKDPPENLYNIQIKDTNGPKGN
jgi:outer membrane protein